MFHFPPSRALTAILLCALLLSACGLAPAPAAQTSEVSPTGTMSETSEVVLPTLTPSPAPTETPTPTPIPGYAIEQLKAMTNDEKLAIAPQVTAAPADVLASFLPQGASATTIAWGEKTLSFWDRVVVYNGQADSPGGKQDIKLYYDLESGQWARKYESFEEAAQIPAGQVPDVMVLTDPIMGDDRLLRAKLQYDYDWISQPPAEIPDGKKIFRDEKGYPKAVFDTVAKKWLTPEEADVVWTLEKWKEAFDVPHIRPVDGKESNYKIIFEKKWSELLTDPSQIEKLPNGTYILILNPSGEINHWTSKKEAVERQKEGAVIIVGKGSSQTEKNKNFIYSTAWKIAFHHYQKGNKSIFVTYGDVGAKRTEIIGLFSPEDHYKIDELPLVKDKKTGRIVSPVIRMPRHLTYGTNTDIIPVRLKPEISNPDFWIDELISIGAKMISIWSVEGYDSF